MGTGLAARMHRTTGWRRILLAAFASSLLCYSQTISAQEYVSPLNPILTGRSPGVKTRLLASSGDIQEFALVLAPGDEILSAIKEFAIKYKVRSAHFTAIGDVTSLKFGWFDESKKMFKLFQFKESLEVTSLVGDIALNDTIPVVHAHINVASQDGIVHGGHLLEGFVSPTMELFITVEPTALYKKLNPEFNLYIMNPDLKK